MYVYVWSGDIETTTCFFPQDPRFMNFLGNLCVCAGTPIPATQSEEHIIICIIVANTVHADVSRHRIFTIVTLKTYCIFNFAVSERVLYRGNINFHEL